MSYREIFTGKRLERFMARIGPVEDSGCRLWTGAWARDYRAIAWLPEGRSVSAARVLWELTYRDVTLTDEVCRHPICHDPR